MSAKLLHFNMHAIGLKPELEYQFHDTRKWRFDFAFPQQKVAVEYEGGVFSGGRHTRGSGFQGDCEKYNAAALAGWLVYRFTAKHVKSGEAIQTIEQAVENGRQVKTRWEDELS